MKNFPCPLCKQIINKFGDHATCCTKQGDLIVRHNSLRNLVEDFASDGMLSPVLEKEGILGNTTGRRPGDVTIQRWAKGKGLAADVAVTSPLAATSVKCFQSSHRICHASVWRHTTRRSFLLLVRLSV